MFVHKQRVHHHFLSATIFKFADHQEEEKKRRLKRKMVSNLLKHHCRMK